MYNQNLEHGALSVQASVIIRRLCCRPGAEDTNSANSFKVVLVKDWTWCIERQKAVLPTLLFLMVFK